MVLCLAGTVNRRAAIQPKAEDTSWIVVPNLWGGIIAEPGLLKSPVIQTVTRPLQQIQELWWQEHEQAKEDFTRENEEYELRRAAWREQYKAATKKGKDTGALTESPPPAPRLRRLLVNDATFEALHVTLSENPAGVLVVRDELTGWWSQLDRQGREGERAFYLQAWNGDTAVTVDRIGRGNIHVPNCCVSMLGGIQPARLRSYLVDAIADGPMNDGLIQRFQVIVWPDTPSNWHYVDRPVNAFAENAARTVFERLVKLDPANPLRFRFSADAQSLFVAWLFELESKVRNNEMHAALVSHLSKYRSLMPSLAVLFELADGGRSEVSLEHAQQAAACCAYLQSHAERIYSCVVTPQLRSARELAEKIKTQKVGVKGVFTCREVYIKGWSGLDTPESVKKAAEVLQDACWVREIPPDIGAGGGRPSNQYAVHPRFR
jgi:putative DNA primase/helicase